MTLRGSTLPEITSSWSDATQILEAIKVLLAIVTLLQAGWWGNSDSHPHTQLCSRVPAMKGSSTDTKRSGDVYTSAQERLHFGYVMSKLSLYAVFAPSQEYKLTLN